MSTFGNQTTARNGGGGGASASSYRLQQQQLHHQTVSKNNGGGGRRRNPSPSPSSSFQNLHRVLSMRNLMVAVVSANAAFAALASILWYNYKMFVQADLFYPVLWALLVALVLSKPKAAIITAISSYRRSSLSFPEKLLWVIRLPLDNVLDTFNFLEREYSLLAKWRKFASPMRSTAHKVCNPTVADVLLAMLLLRGGGGHSKKEIDGGSNSRRLENTRMDVGQDKNDNNHTPGGVGGRATEEDALMGASKSYLLSSSSSSSSSMGENNDRPGHYSTAANLGTNTDAQVLDDGRGAEAGGTATAATISLSASSPLASPSSSSSSSSSTIITSAAAGLSYEYQMSHRPPPSSSSSHHHQQQQYHPRRVTRGATDSSLDSFESGDETSTWHDTVGAGNDATEEKTDSSKGGGKLKPSTDNHHQLQTTNAPPLLPSASLASSLSSSAPESLIDTTEQVQQRQQHQQALSPASVATDTTAGTFMTFASHAAQNNNNNNNTHALAQNINNSNRASALIIDPSSEASLPPPPGMAQLFWRFLGAGYTLWVIAAYFGTFLWILTLALTYWVVSRSARVLRKRSPFKEFLHSLPKRMDIIQGKLAITISYIDQRLRGIPFIVFTFCKWCFISVYRLMGHISRRMGDILEAGVHPLTAVLLIVFMILAGVGSIVIVSNLVIDEWRDAVSDTRHEVMELMSRAPSVLAATGSYYYQDQLTPLVGMFDQGTALLLASGSSGGSGSSFDEGYEEEDEQEEEEVETESDSESRNGTTLAINRMAKNTNRIITDVDIEYNNDNNDRGRARSDDEIARQFTAEQVEQAELVRKDILQQSRGKRRRRSRDRNENQQQQQQQQQQSPHQPQELTLPLVGGINVTELIDESISWLSHQWPNETEVIRNIWQLYREYNTTINSISSHQHRQQQQKDQDVQEDHGSLLSVQENSSASSSSSSSFSSPHRRVVRRVCTPSASSSSLASKNMSGLSVKEDGTVVTEAKVEADTSNDTTEVTMECVEIEVDEEFEAEHTRDEHREGGGDDDSVVSTTSKSDKTERIVATTLITTSKRNNNITTTTNKNNNNNNNLCGFPNLAGMRDPHTREKIPIWGLLLHMVQVKGLSTVLNPACFPSLLASIGAWDTSTASSLHSSDTSGSSSLNSFASAASALLNPFANISIAGFGLGNITSVLFGENGSAWTSSSSSSFSSTGSNNGGGGSDSSNTGSSSSSSEKSYFSFLSSSSNSSENADDPNNDNNTNSSMSYLTRGLHALGFGDADGNNSNGLFSSSSLSSSSSNLSSSLADIGSSITSSLPLPSVESVMQSSAAVMSFFGQATSLVISYAVSASASVVSFLLSLTLFLNLLFYLLAAPQSWLSSALMFLPSHDQLRVQEVLSQTVRGVFVVNAKMAAYHALFTFMILNWMRVHFVVTASALSAVGAVIPFFPTFLLVLPAAIEVTFVQGSIMKGLALLFFHATFLSYADWYMCESADTVHPAALGLAIIAGSVSFGTQGAVLGPLLVSALVACYKLYKLASNPIREASERSSSSGGDGDDGDEYEYNGENNDDDGRGGGSHNFPTTQNNTALGRTGGGGGGSNSATTATTAMKNGRPNNSLGYMTSTRNVSYLRHNNSNNNINTTTSNNNTSTAAGKTPGTRTTLLLNRQKAEYGSFSGRSSASWRSANNKNNHSNSNNNVNDNNNRSMDDEDDLMATVNNGTMGEREINAMNDDNNNVDDDEGVIGYIDDHNNVITTTPSSSSSGQMNAQRRAPWSNMSGVRELLPTVVSANNSPATSTTGGSSSIPRHSNMYYSRSFTTKEEEADDEGGVYDQSNHRSGGHYNNNNNNNNNNTPQSVAGSIAASPTVVLARARTLGIASARK